MAPSCIIIVRHGEREDHKNPSFATTYPRPHDSPLTAVGADMGRKLGGFLAYRHKVMPGDVVVLSSPLVRCIETSNALVEGLRRHVKMNDRTDVPIYLEPAIMEGAYYLLHDMRKNPNVASKSQLIVPETLTFDAAYLKENYSKYVQVNKPFSLGEPRIARRHNELQEPKFIERNQEGARALLKTPQLDGKTVILVGHGETVKLWYKEITGAPELDFCPPYTAFVVLRPTEDEKKPGVLKWVADGPVLTQEHLQNPAPIVHETTEE